MDIVATFPFHHFRLLVSVNCAWSAVQVTVYDRLLLSHQFPHVAQVPPSVLIWEIGL
jgi:hypothetical protein